METGDVRTKPDPVTSHRGGDSGGERTAAAVRRSGHTGHLRGGARGARGILRRRSLRHHAREALRRSSRGDVRGGGMAAVARRHPRLARRRGDHGGTALALVLAHTGSGLPQLGPIPGLKEETYDAAQLVTLAAEVAFLVLAAVRLLLPSRSR